MYLHTKVIRDTKVDELDWQKEYLAIVSRIIEHGGQQEIDEIIRFYGHEKVITTIRDKFTSYPIMRLTRL